MQLFVLLMMVALIVHDSAAASLSLKPSFNSPAMLAAVVGSYVALAAFISAGCLWVQRILSRHPGAGRKWVARLELMLNASRAIIVGLFIAQLYVMGALLWLRQTLGDWILLNEVLALTPPLATVAITWWAYYPIDRRMREATLIRDLDGGHPVWPIWTRGQYLLSQVRHQVLLLLVPLLALLGWTQIVDRLIAPAHPWDAYKSALTLAGGFVIFLFAPLMIRHVWDTVPLPPGQLRSRLLALCDRYRVRIRELLLWRTYGGLVNGAVMGLISPTRYILLTDGLIERLEDDQVEAVMAHELGHVRRHHMPWLAICAVALLMGWAALLEAGVMAVEATALMQPLVSLEYWREATDVALMATLLAGWFLAFGYISRRFERQADTFAVQHLSRRLAEENGHRPDRVTEEGANIMIRALYRVSELSHSPPDRPSWRHGAIAWRVDYLRSLVGVPLHQCSIDQHVRSIRFVCLAIGIIALLITQTLGH